VGRRPSILATGLFVATTLIGAGAADGQSFDCRHARSADEVTICQEAGLAKLDQDLASLQRQRKEKRHKAERDPVDDNETAFLNARRRCGENHACIAQSYRNRIQELSQSLSEEGREPPSRASASAKRAERRNGSTEDDQRPQERLTPPGETQPGASETAIEPMERQTQQSETRPAISPPTSRPEARSRNAAEVPTPPSRQEAQAAIAGISAPEKRNRHKEGANIGSAGPAPSPEIEKAPASAGTAGHSPKTSEKRHTKPPVAVAAPPSADQEVQAIGTSAAPVERQPSADVAPHTGTTASEPPKQHAKRNAPATAQRAPTGTPTIQWVDPPPSR